MIYRWPQLSRPRYTRLVILFAGALAFCLGGFHSTAQAEGPACQMYNGCSGLLGGVGCCGCNTNDACWCTSTGIGWKSPQCNTVE